MENNITVYCDGGARGNPGPAACGYLIKKDAMVVHQANRFLGNTTNNIAEYSGVLDALSWIWENKKLFVSGQKITFLLDSLLVVNQLNGIFKIKNDSLRNLAIQIKSLIKKINLPISFINIPREKNSEADFLVNDCLDNTQVSLLKQTKSPQLF